MNEAYQYTRTHYRPRECSVASVLLWSIVAIMLALGVIAATAYRAESYYSQLDKMDRV